MTILIGPEYVSKAMEDILRRKAGGGFKDQHDTLIKLGALHSKSKIHRKMGGSTRAWLDALSLVAS